MPRRGKNIAAAAAEDPKGSEIELTAEMQDPNISVPKKQKIVSVKSIVCDGNASDLLVDRNEVNRSLEFAHPAAV